MPGNKQPFQFAVIAALIALSSVALGDVGPGLYVSESGADRGDCTNVERPCATIRYALSMAGKNTRIHVAEGTYKFDSHEDILYAMSGAVHVHGGYVRDDQGQWIKGGKAILTSVPPGYRDFFSMHGFIAIADAKGDEEFPETAAAMLEIHQSAQQSAPAANCVAGSAAGFECLNVDLLSQTARQSFSSNPGSVADIWGFVDLNTRREYVIVGVRNGTAVFDVTDPERPREIGFVGGQSATWRDVKIFQVYDATVGRWTAYAYVTTDGASDGLKVIDLTGLPHSIAQLPYASDFQNAHNVYLTDTDYSTGLALDGATPHLVVAGSGIDSGQFRIYSLTDPAAPAFLRRVAGAGYMHDASSLRISDSRADACTGSGPCNVLLDFNEQNVELWDLTDPDAPARLAIVPQYPNSGYVHSGWWSEDRRFVFVHDELDEQNFALPTTLRVLSLENLTSPVMVGQWTGNEASVDHNGFVRGNRYYMSTYTSGLKILDITDAARPVEAGAFDTYPTSDRAIFAGAWGAYPYLPSGAIAVSDINTGLHLLRDRTRAVAAGSLEFAAPSFGGEEGQTLELPVRRVGGSIGAVSVGLELVPATADGSDIELQVDRLSWAAGDASTRSLRFLLASDPENEELEELIVRLVDPQGGATLGEMNVASLFVTEASATSALELVTADVEVPEQGPGAAVLTVKRTGSASGAASVDFSVSSGTASRGSDYDGPANGTLSWADGDALPKSIEFGIVADVASESDEFYDVTFTNAQGATFIGSLTATILIREGASSNSAPVAAVDPNQTRTAGSNVMLNGSGSFDPDGDTLTYRWRQDSGPSVSLNGASTDAATFVAPQVSTNAALQFTLTVSDDRGLSDSATTTVTVTPRQDGGNSGNNSGGGSGAPGPLVLTALVLALVCRGRR